MTTAAINAQIAELRQQRSEVKGTQTEVYARIVGYYRSVRNWNLGKKEEYGKRLNFENITPSTAPKTPLAPVLKVVSPSEETAQQGDGVPASYLYFFRKTCPNCPPVARVLETSGLAGRHIDVDRESGITEASRYDITAAPTVVVLDAAGEEIGRGSSAGAVEDRIGLAAVTGA